MFSCHIRAKIKITIIESEEMVPEMRKCRGLLLLFCAILAFASGCGASGPQEEERKETAFTLVSAEKLPEELAELIEENKKEEIRMTYTDAGETYLVRGYGEQKTGGYSIEVVRCESDEQTLFFDTRLLGPETGKRLQKEPSYPVLVAKTKADGKEVQIT